MSLDIKCRDGADPDQSRDLGAMAIDDVGTDGAHLDVGSTSIFVPIKRLPVVLLLGAVAANLGRIVDRLDTLIELQRPKPSPPYSKPKPRSMPAGPF